MVTVVGKCPTLPKRVTCLKCASILEYTRNETFEIKVNHDYLGDYDYVSAIKCPTCGNDQPVN